MITKIFAVVVAVLILGFGSVASAATTHKPVRHHSQSVRTGITPINFQSSWDVSYKLVPLPPTSALFLQLWRWRRCTPLPNAGGLASLLRLAPPLSIRTFAQRVRTGIYLLLLLGRPPLLQFV